MSKLFKRCSSAILSLLLVLSSILLMTTAYAAEGDLDLSTATTQELVDDMNGSILPTNNQGDSLNEVTGVEIVATELIYDAFPSESEIVALSNNVFFTTRGFYAKMDGFGCTYYASTSYQANSLHIGTKYVAPVNQPVGEIFLPYYGIRTGAAYAVSNSAALAAIYNINFGSVLKFPAGHFYFDSAIVLTGSQLKLMGVAPVGYTIDTNTSGLTWLHFPNLTDGQSAITTGATTISNIIFYGNPDTYNCVIDRTKTVTDPTHIVTETNTIKTYGINATSFTDIQNCSFRYFYYGIYCATGNTTINNIFGRNCHTVASIGNDTKVNGIFGFNAMVVLEIRGSISSAITIRGDSIGKHLVHIISGAGIYLSDLDADYCLGSILHLGNGNWETIENLLVDGMHGRHGTYKAYDKTLSTGPTVDDVLTSEDVENYPIISVNKQCAVMSAKFSILGYGNSNPMDAASNYLTPSILFVADTSTTVQGVDITIVGSKLATTDTTPFDKTWLSKRVKSFSSNTRNLEMSISTAFDKIFLKRSGAITVYSKVTVETIP